MAEEIERRRLEPGEFVNTISRLGGTALLRVVRDEYEESDEGRFIQLKRLDDKPILEMRCNVFAADERELLKVAWFSTWNAEQIERELAAKKQPGRKRRPTKLNA
ncbi:hypothetical protein [Blastopirellula retiformator]|uniref:Uncharacterized protein n=1 Tax=Blastopirellula retiformator TaxID=2527970 RepID=A0A5C5VL23_9BACT|nr:hypothetical protein [Blastopirellula retiformator]TWT38687.1 hypothetical protein Enr8_03810 [Blastopirellula retiformator]